MKRILCLILAVLLALCALLALFACQSTGNGGDGGKPRATVSALEWAAAFDMTNVTATGYLTERDERESVLFKAADTAYFSELDGYRSYYIKRDGDYYFYEDDDTEGIKFNLGISISVGMILMSYRIADYSDFTFDEATQSYYTTEGLRTGAARYDLYFENGKIVKFESRDDTGAITVCFSFTDYGSTVVDLPDYMK